MPGSRSPGFTPPHWPRRLGARPGAFKANGGLAPAVVTIPFSWIAWPITRKPTVAITQATIAQLDGATGYSSASAARVRQYGVNTAQATLDTDCDADPQNLAAFLTTYQSVPRPRQPTLTFNLIARSDDECLVILGVALAQRVRIIEAPTSAPPGALNFTVEGIRHVLGVEERTVTWSTSALIGSSTDSPGPWFRLGSSSLGGSDLIPF